MSAYVSDEDLLAAVEAAASYPTRQAAADSIGIPRKTLTNRLEIANRRNLTRHAFGGVVPDGFELTKITTLMKSEDGKVMEWQHRNAVRDKQKLTLEEVAAALNAAIVPVLPTTFSGFADKDLMTMYPIPDLHLGQYSWGKETAESYDLDVADRTFKAASIDLMSMTPPSAVALIINFGDYFHADSNDATTPKSKNHLDVDSRYEKVQMKGAELEAWFVDLALQKHESVIVVNLPGNHDPRGGGVLSLAMWMRYFNEPRVSVDRKPGDFYFYTFGTTMIAAHHGHNAKPEQMAGVMAAYEPEMWGKTKFRYAFSGHQHRRIKGRDQDEKGGAIWEVFQAITAKDAWNRSMGHSAGRSMVAITFHNKRGEVVRHYSPI